MCDDCGCRSYPPIGELTAEHEEILTQAWALAEAHATGRPLPPVAVDALVALLDVHVVKEETGIYPQLIAGFGLSAEENARLEEEHRQIKDALTGGAWDRRAFYVLSAHVEAEEMDLFPAAMFGFADDEWDAMEAAHRAAESGAGALP